MAYIKKPSQVVDCKGCGNPFKRDNGQQYYCTRQCRQSFYDKGRKCRKKPGAHPHRERGPFICGHCEKEYYTRRPIGEGDKYCSRSCAFKDASAWMKKTVVPPYSKLPDYSRLYLCVCKQCGNDFVSRTRNKRYCSDACGLAFGEASRIRRGKAQHVSKDIECGECGDHFSTIYGDMRTVFCSDVCSAKHNKRIRNHEERARKRNATVERFDPISVLNRDKWKCQMCGIKTSRKLRGTIDDNAPELDHIIPLSKGGEHSRRNTQCLCRKCNNEKSNAIVGQLLMFG